MKQNQKATKQHRSVQKCAFSPRPNPWATLSFVLRFEEKKRQVPRSGTVGYNFTQRVIRAPHMGINSMSKIGEGAFLLPRNIVVLLPHIWPTQQAFTCGFGAENEDCPKNGANKRAGRGQRRKEGNTFPSIPSPYPLIHSLALVPFFTRPKPKIPLLGFSSLQNQTETLARQVTPNKDYQYPYCSLLCA